jgi:NAD(P) transhydrogenase subunit alpha
MQNDKIADGLKDLSSRISDATDVLLNGVVPVPEVASSHFVMGLTVLILAVFVGYHVVWKVTPALHSPLMAVTNAISSVIIVGALIAAGPEDAGISKFFGLIAVILASINIFGGFIVSQRMLAMFRKK